ncbi:dihydrodipicolinate synthase family protein [Acidicapsa dinghuensis]|uniref:Dihydrodipicolinate synthase family protein n=1 Tax=Acidicapsa dinghuensis TaxID=2218256 RepID=A0ABW1EGH7_9BACT|nr:dihydrodipicolinate synthase family protein [Acidicapsa dinghuensis]
MTAVYNGIMLLEGIFAPVTTPFYPDERIYFKKLEFNVSRLSLTALSGLVVLGSTGEAVALNDAETREALSVAASAAADEKVLIAGIGRESVKATVELAEYAVGRKYDAVLVRNPCYYRPQLTPESLLHYFRSVADHSPLPVILYSIPKFTQAEIPLEVVAELAHHPNIIGLKESSGNVERVGKVIEATKNAPKRTIAVTPVFEAVTGRMLTPKALPMNFIPADGLTGGTEAALALAIAPPPPAIRTRTKEVGFQVLVGSTATLKESLDLGATGAILAFATCAPQACQEIYTAWKERDHALAEEKQRHIAEASNVVGSTLGIAGVKYACDFNGYYGGKPRGPLLPLDGPTKARVEDLLAQIRH